MKYRESDPETVAFVRSWNRPDACEKCGKELQVGQWPWCPHEDARGFGDAPIEPYFDEHVSQEGAYITSRGQRRAIMSKNHLEYHDVSRKKRGKVYVCMGGK